MHPTTKEAPPLALLTDLWYTLVYHVPRDRSRVESTRRGILRRALRGAGLPVARVRSVLSRFESDSQWAERSGRTPALAARIRRLARIEGIRLPVRQLVDDLDDVLRQYPPRLASGALRALQTLRTHGFRLGLVSNTVSESAAGARRLLRRLRLADLFDGIALSVDDGIGKPDPRPFRRCLDQLGVSPSHAWYVGDLPTDVSGAVAAGLHPVQFVGISPFNPGVPDPPPAPERVVVHRWEELPPLLMHQR